MIITTQGNEALTVRHQIGIASGFGSERCPASRLETPSGFIGIRTLNMLGKIELIRRDPRVTLLGRQGKVSILRVFLDQEKKGHGHFMIKGQIQ